MSDFRLRIKAKHEQLLRAKYTGNNNDRLHDINNENTNRNNSDNNNENEKDIIIKRLKVYGYKDEYIKNAFRIYESKNMHKNGYNIDDISNIIIKETKNNNHNNDNKSFNKKRKYKDMVSISELSIEPIKKKRKLSNDINHNNNNIRSNNTLLNIHELTKKLMDNGYSKTKINRGIKLYHKNFGNTQQYSMNKMVSIIHRIIGKDIGLKNEYIKTGLNANKMARDIHYLLFSAKDTNSITKKYVKEYIEKKYKLPKNCLFLIKNDELCNAIKIGVQQYNHQNNQNNSNINIQNIT